ncbi:DUF1405 domain-containing protein [Bacillus carboniphilus]|uniref:DUF1405 domain-containing protein n=1 Tax=Bacillus carboniphilus TaxID=86663 RepID=UPI0035322F8A
MKQLYYVLTRPPFLWLLLVINVFGTVYGYYWYRYQLAYTDWKFILFVPDSPTATLFFIPVLIAFLFRKNSKWFEAFAMLSLFKYGVWAVIMNLLVLYTTGELSLAGYMLIASHGGMALQGLLYAPYYRFKLKHLAIASIVLLHNEMIDYVFGQMPVYSGLSAYRDIIGYFTFWLSIISIAIAYRLVLHKNATKYHITF